MHKYVYRILSLFIFSRPIIIIIMPQEKFKREFYRRFSFFNKFGIGKRFHQSANGCATGITTMTDYPDRSVCHTRASFSSSHHPAHVVKKSCCVRNENLLRGGSNNGVVLKNSYTTDDDDDQNFTTITSNPFIESNNRAYRSSDVDQEDFEFTKII